MHRFFVPPPDGDLRPTALAGQPVVLTGDQAHQIRRVLRLRLGERVTLLDGRGRACEAILVAYGDEDVKFQTVRHWDAPGEPRTHITLFQAVLKGEHFAWALQKGTEVGVSRFVPTVCARNVVGDMEAIEQKRERWERIIQEAAEQSGRGCLPELAPAQLFTRAVQPPPGSSLREEGGEAGTASGGRPYRLILWEGERALGLYDALADCNFAIGARIQVFIGPEGGFTSDEVQLAQRYSVCPVTLGPRILRAETAGVVATALILYEAGEI
jgi:16S rRNA (uracil1498-N3)-methyltransferase